MILFMGKLPGGGGGCCGMLNFEGRGNYVKCLD